jgi:hypothetical protein
MVDPPIAPGISDSREVAVSNTRENWVLRKRILRDVTLVPVARGERWQHRNEYGRKGPIVLWKYTRVDGDILDMLLIDQKAIFALLFVVGVNKGC